MAEADVVVVDLQARTKLVAAAADKVPTELLAVHSSLETNLANLLLV